VVHINAAVAGLVGAYMVGKRVRWQSLATRVTLGTLVIFVSASPPSLRRC